MTLEKFISGKRLKVLNSRWRSRFLNDETSANIANSDNKVGNKQLKTMLAVNDDKQSIESH